MQSEVNFRHLGRFSAVGVLNTLIDFLIFTVFSDFLGAGYISSQVAGYSCGVDIFLRFPKKYI
jgi:putative flippase GtrA